MAQPSFNYFEEYSTTLNNFELLTPDSSRYYNGSSQNFDYSIPETFSNSNYITVENSNSCFKTTASENDGSYLSVSSSPDLILDLHPRRRSKRSNSGATLNDDVKRRKNALAAHKSRQKKLDLIENLKSKLDGKDDEIDMLCQLITKLVEKNRKLKKIHDNIGEELSCEPELAELTFIRRKSKPPTNTKRTIKK